jgi:aspartyl-tRNA(Asn)/glutamyl-tRNA(Gln) amidotransferase subunit A
MDARDFTVDSLTAAYRDGSLSPVEATKACLRQIEQLDGELNGFVLVDEDRALASARESQARWQAGTPRGPIDGVPASIKDLVLVEGWPTLKGSPHLDPNELATETAPVAQRLIDAGAVLVGKTTTPESGWKGLTDSPVSGYTRNPWNPERTSGGSSGGAAVAAATGMAVLNVGTDGGGSIRMPAGFCGVFGIKPTHALIPMYPPGVSGLLSHLGPLTPTVRDSAFMMSAIAGPDRLDIYPTQTNTTSWIDQIEDGVVGLRIAFSPDFGHAVVNPEIAAATRRSVEILTGLGAIVDEVQIDFSDCRDSFLTLWDAAIGRTLNGVPAEQWKLSDPGLVATCERGQVITAQQFLDADAVRAQATLKLSRLLDQYDILISPQLPLTAFPIGSDVADPSTQSHWVDWTPFTYPINMTRHPAATVPTGLASDGLPMAVQLVGRHFDDRLVLRVARALEKAQPFPRLS